MCNFREQWKLVSSQLDFLIQLSGLCFSGPELVQELESFMRPATKCALNPCEGWNAV